MVLSFYDKDADFDGKIIEGNSTSSISVYAILDLTDRVWAPVYSSFSIALRLNWFYSPKISDGSFDLFSDFFYWNVF